MRNIIFLALFAAPMSLFGQSSMAIAVPLSDSSLHEITIVMDDGDGYRYLPLWDETLYYIGTGDVESYRHVNADGEFAYVFSETETDACAWCICFGEAGGLLVVRPNGDFDFNGKTFHQSFASYLAVYDFIRGK